MISEALFLNQANEIAFVMVDSTYTEVPGLGAGVNLFISKAGGAFAPVAGAVAEIGNGWYTYTLTAAECDTIGPLALYGTAVGCIQQNLTYNVLSPVITAIQFTYTVTDVVTLAPIDGVQCWFATDVAGAHVVWTGFTDAFGVARDEAGKLPFLDPGTYYIFRQRTGYTFADPDVELVS